ncbi:hypothetical protein JCM17844_27270 [Iodidimonas gelatinilytica]|uniref:Activator of Hsp90 ATPase homologue 1/2-like C-terminal domain-containing protein n=1 Tax=Iodidimonas gelatinilytica TaxID=1236966 RepID=A0A5A7MT69_9PROT|nr:SRPBCC domain-containing protein [Iodidimonas gelatinilytica]GEQ99090.1 hypothetical protein JCM17844_27270 [Iodidimonas gelatinilytica]
MRYLILALMFFSAWTTPAQAQSGADEARVTKLESRAFSLSHQVELPASTSEVWAAITSDISGWWDHSFADTPARLFIKAQPGGAFYEYFDEAGQNGVVHARVIYAEADKRLVLDGPLGFNGHAVTIITTWELQPSEQKTRSILTARLSVSGVYQDGWDTALESVWAHFLSGRLKGYLEAGCRGGGPCAAFP